MTLVYNFKLYEELPTVIGQFNNNKWYSNIPILTFDNSTLSYNIHDINNLYNSLEDEKKIHKKEKETVHFKKDEGFNIEGSGLTEIIKKMKARKSGRGILKL